MDTSQIIVALQAVIGILVCIMLILIAVYFLISRKKDNDASKLENEFIIEEKKTSDAMPSGDFGKFQGVLTRESIFDFMEFDEIVDNMIVRKNRTQYVMVLACSGVNYDLMSLAEKYAVEEGFVQFLNTLRFSIQLYVQSRTLNLRDIIASYKERVENITNDISKLNTKIAQAKQTGNKALLEKLECNPKTIMSFAGIGDLILTCSSPKSRNYRYGLVLGKRKSKEEIEEYLKENTTEGYYTLLSIKGLTKNRKIKMPIINIIYDIAINHKDPDILVDFLINKA